MKASWTITQVRILAQTLAISTCFRHSNGPMLCRTRVFSHPEWFAEVNVNSRKRPPSSAQHLTDANSDTGPITIADSWLPTLGQYCAVLSPSAIHTWGYSIRYSMLHAVMSWMTMQISWHILATQILTQRVSKCNSS